MNISAEERNRYLRETEIVLAREGFRTDRTDTGKLRVLLDGAPLCEVTENGGITYRNEDINELERVAAKDKVYEIVRTTAEYMRQMENGARFESRWFRGRLQGAGGFQWHCAGWSLEQVRSSLRHMGLGLWAHRCMSWSLFHGELCRSQTGLCYPLWADSKGTTFQPRADDRDLSLLCRLCRQRFL